jgi:hypothetical protein
MFIYNYNVPYLAFINFIIILLTYYHGEVIFINIIKLKSPMDPRSMRFGEWSRKLSNVGQSLDRWPKMYYLELLRASERTLSRWSRLHLQSLAPTNPHWARVVGYGPFSLCVIHKEGLCPSSGDINRLMMEAEAIVCLLERANLRNYRSDLKNSFIVRQSIYRGRLW